MKFSRRIFLNDISALALIILIGIIYSIYLVLNKPSAETSSRLAVPLNDVAQGKEKSFILVGLQQFDDSSPEHKAKTFTEKEIQEIAQKYSLVIIAAHYGRNNRETHDELAQRLKEYNSDIKILPYLSSTFFQKGASYNKANADNNSHEFNNDWLLKYDCIEPNSESQLCQAKIGQTPLVDLSNSEYRSWVNSIIKNWNSKKTDFGQDLYNGVFLDNFSRLAVTSKTGQRGIEYWEPKLGQEKIDAYNLGLEAFLKEIHDNLNEADKYISINGITDIKWIPNRNLYFLDNYDFTDALNEEFCYYNPTRKAGAPRELASKETIKAEIDLLLTYAEDDTTNHLIFEKTNHMAESLEELNQKSRDAISRYCYGSFLLGYVPGKTYFKFGYGYDQVFDEIGQNAREINLNLGQPVGDYERIKAIGVYASDDDFIFRRQFQNGWVYVNMEQKGATVKSPENLAIVNRGVENKIYKSIGENIYLPPQDARFLIKTK